MGGCGSKSENVVPQGKNMLYSNDPVMSGLEKELKLSEQRYEVLQLNYNLSKKIAENPENSFPLPQDIKQKLQYLEQNSTESLKTLSRVQELVKALKDTATSSSFGKQVDAVKQNQKKLEEFLNFFDTDIHKIKEMWVKQLMKHGLKLNLQTKLPKSIEKLGNLLNQLEKKIEECKNNTNIFKQRIDFYTSNEELSSQKSYVELLTSILNRHNQRLIDAQAAFNNVRLNHVEHGKQVTDPVTKSADINALSELAGSISEDKQIIKTQLARISGDKDFEFQVLFLGTFSLESLISRNNREFKVVLLPLLSKYEDNFNSFQKALEIQKISEQDEDRLNELSETEAEVEAIIKNLSQIKQEAAVLERDMATFQQAQTSIENNELAPEELVDVIQQYREQKERLNKLIDDAYNLNRDSELKKIMISSANINIKFDFSQENLDQLREQFQQKSEQSDNLYNLIDEIKKLFDNSNNSLLKVVSENLKNLQDQLNEFNLQDIQDQFQKVELSFNECINFWKEKEESGEYINNPEDAKTLIENLGNFEDSYFDLELKVSQLAIVNDVVESNLRKVMFRPIVALGMLTNEYLRIRNFIGEKLKNQSHDQSIQRSKKHDGIKHKIFQFQTEIPDADIYSQNFKASIQNLIQVFSKYQTKFAKVSKILEQVNERIDFTLQWGPENNSVIIEGMKEPNNVVKIEQHSFKVNNQASEIQKKLVEHESEEKRQRFVEIKEIKEPEYQIGKTFKTNLLIIEQTLCLQYNGANLPWDEFVRSQYLEIIKKDTKPNVKVDLPYFREKCECFTQ